MRHRFESCRAHTVPSAHARLKAASPEAASRHVSFRREFSLEEIARYYSEYYEEIRLRLTPPAG
jgi:hypothetical protein